MQLDRVPLEAWERFADFTTALGAVPIIAVVLLYVWRNKMLDSEWWLIGLAYSVSWLADSVGEKRIIAYNSYVLLQCGLLVLPLVKKVPAMILVGLYAVVGVAATVFLGPNALAPLHTVGWLSVCGVALWRLRPGPLRASILWTFGLGYLAWWHMRVAPTHPNVFWFQCTRILGTLLLISALRRPFLGSLRCGSSIRWSGYSFSLRGSPSSST